MRIGGPSLAFRGVPLHLFAKCAADADSEFRGRTMKIKASLALLVSALSLASCMDQGPRQMPIAVRQAPAQLGVEGVWRDDNGLSSTFTGGQFETRTTDGTNTQMASGTYSMQPNGVVQINLYSNVKRQNSLVNCQQLVPGRLNCTTENNTQFSLHRA